MPNFFNKEKYVFHYENLQLYVRQGLKQKNSYTEFNTQKGKEAKKKKKNKDNDGKPLYKLMNNVVYGKTMKNLRNKIDVKIESNKKYYLIWISKPS